MRFERHHYSVSPLLLLVSGVGDYHGYVRMGLLHKSTCRCTGYYAK